MSESIKNDRKDNKVMMELLPWPELEEIAKVYTAGAKKYGPHNWENLPDGYERYKGAMLRHLTEVEKGNEIDKDTYIADTPGFSTFSIEEIPSKDLANYFQEFKSQIKNCEFIGCTHIKEENCGIKKAIQDGKIDKSRYERFCKIYQELKNKEERKKW